VRKDGVEMLPPRYVDPLGMDARVNRVESIPTQEAAYYKMTPVKFHMLLINIFKPI